MATGVLDDFDLRPFAPAIRFGSGRHAVTVGDPRADVRHALGSLRHHDLSLGDALRIARLLVEVRRRPVSLLTAGRDTTTRSALLERGISEEAIDGLLRPFLRGALLDDELTTSWHFTELVLKSLSAGRPGTHPRGIAALPAALAASLPAGHVHLTEPAVSVTPSEVVTARRRCRARAVIVSSDASSAHELLDTPDIAWRGLTTWWWSLPSLHGTDQLRIDTRRRVLSNALDVSSAAPERAPRGRSLVAASVNGDASDISDRSVRDDVARLYDVDVPEVILIDRTRVRRALPVVATPLDLRRSQEVRGVIVAGDYLHTPSIQGALVSGRRAARLALARIDSPQ